MLQRQTRSRSFVQLIYMHLCCAAEWPHPDGPDHPGPGERDEQERPVPEAAGRAAERLHKQITNVNKIVNARSLKN